ncbi:hypothetical protein Vretimale_16594 [Volvox reticuliferus]|uniref:Uncharacterized protein n=1 Tax=Volvox reticuliferus TaxID=1737510 RepID=A0A8J4LWD5_9CHLO|nr:hypothetical protein Vretimale_16594 [Volvox reticuliferus]
MSDSLEQLQRRERELTELRNRTLQSLEQQVAAQEREIGTLNEQLEALTSDFTYNLDLLRQRDEELAAYDEAAVQSQAQETALRGRVTQLEQLVTELEAELRSARAAAEQQGFLLAAKRAELTQLLEEEKLGRTEALMRQREQAETVRRALQRELEEARQQAERQRAALNAAFQQQLQEAQAAMQAEVEQLKQAAAAASQLAEQRQQELQQAASRAAQALQQADTARATVRDQEVALRGLDLELEARAREHDATVRQLEQQGADAERKLRAATESYELYRSQLAEQLSTARQCLEELRSQCLEDIALLQRRHMEEVAALRSRMETASGLNAQLEVEVLELRAQLRVVKDAPKVAALEQQLATERAEVEALRRDRDDAERRLRDAASEQGHEIRQLREKLAEARTSLEERQRDLEAARAQLAAFRQRVAATREAAAQAGPAGGGADIAATSAATANVTTSNIEPADGELPPSPSRPAGGGPQRQYTAGRPAALTLAALQESHDSLPDFGASPLLDLPPSPRSSASFWLGPLSAGGAAVGGLQESFPRSSWSPAAAATAAAAAAARAAQFLRSSKEGLDSLLRPLQRSRLGPTEGMQQQQQPGAAGAGSQGTGMGTSAVTPAEAALAEAEAENQRLRSTLAVMRSEMEALQVAAGAAADSVLMQQQQQGMAWRVGSGGDGAVLETGEEPGGVPTGPADVGARLNAAALMAELQESDRDLQQTLEHMELLQRQLQAARAAANIAVAVGATASGTPTVVTMPQGTLPGVGPRSDGDSAAVPTNTSPDPRAAAAAAAAAAAGAAEVTFLRQRVKELTMANRSLRRRVIQLQAATAVGAAVAAEAVEAAAIAGFPSFDISGTLAQGNTAAAAADADAAAADAIGPTAASQSPLAEKVQQLQQELDRSRSQLAAAREENEKLMELSSEVRAQRDRYAMQLAALMATSTAAAAAAASGALQPLPTDGEPNIPGVLWRKQDFGSPPSPTFGSPLPVSSPPHPLQLVMAATAASPLPLSPIHTSATSLATLLPVFAPSQNPSAGGSIDGGLYSYQYPYGLVNPWGMLPAVGTLPGSWLPYRLPAQPLPGAAAGAARVVKPGDQQERESTERGAEERDSNRSGKPTGRSTSPPTRRVAFDDTGSLHRPTSQSPPRPGNIPSHSANANHVRHNQMRPHSSPNPSSQARSLVNTFDLAAATPASNAEGGEDRPPGAGVTLTVGPAPAPMARASPPVGLTASGRETQSQKAALRALHRRREQHQNQAAAAVAASAALRQRVRSYTVVRDEGGVEDTRGVTTTSWPVL